MQNNFHPDQLVQMIMVQGQNQEALMNMIRSQAERQERMIQTPLDITVEKFDGKADKLSSFLLTIEDVINSRRHQYDSDYERVRLVARNLIGKAASWYSCMVERSDESLLDFQQFKTKLKINFGNAVGKYTAMNIINEMMQGDKRAREHSDNFRNYAYLTGFNEEALVFHYIKSLRNDLQIHVLASRPRPITLEDAILLAVPIDESMRLQPKGGNQRPFAKKPSAPYQNQPPPRSTPGSQDQMVHMELDHIKLNPEERQKRLIEGLCFYCGHSGHQAKSCPASKPKQKNE